MRIKIKRIYEPVDAADGCRVLIDRLWPRGISKERAALCAWIKDAAPSPSLRTWFAHAEERFLEFSRLYRAELEAQPEKQSAVRRLLELASCGNLTLVYGAKSETINHAVVLLQYLLEKDPSQLQNSVGK